MQGHSESNSQGGRPDPLDEIALTPLGYRGPPTGLAAAVQGRIPAGQLRRVLLTYTAHPADHSIYMEASTGSAEQVMNELRDAINRCPGLNTLHASFSAQVSDDWATSDSEPEGFRPVVTRILALVDLSREQPLKEAEAFLAHALASPHIVGRRAFGPFKGRADLQRFYAAMLCADACPYSAERDQLQCSLAFIEGTNMFEVKPLEASHLN